MSDIHVGSIVFHKRLAEDGGFVGPGVVEKIEHDDLFDVDIFHVFWQNTETKFDHFRSSLKTLGEV